MTGGREAAPVLRLYHAGYGEIRRPDVRHGRRNADFGQGFYLSPDPGFAGRWVRERRGARAVVNEYLLDCEGLDVLRLERDADWCGMILANRAGRGDLVPEADVIAGPIANDTLYDTMGILSSGAFPPEQVLELLRVGPCYTQVAVKSERAAGRLRWTGAREPDADELERFRAQVQAEQEAYLQALAARMEAL